MIKTAITRVQVVWGLLNGTMALTPLGMVVFGITAVVTALYLLYQNWDKVTSFISGEIEIIKTNLGNMVNAVKEKASAVWEG